MANTDSFDAGAYARLPKMNVAAAVAVGSALVASVPKSAPPDVKASARKLRTSIVDIKQIWAGRMPQTKSPKDPRTSDRRADNAWGALHGRVQAASWLPRDVYPVAESAAHILDKVFSDGLSFLTLPYPSEWAESEKRLAQIDAENLGPEIEKVAGREFIDEVRAAHAEYGETVRSMLTREAEASASLLEPLRTVMKRMSAHTRKLVALVDEDEPATIAMVETALRPIAAYREMEARRGAVGETGGGELPPANPTNPTPDVP